MEEIEYKRGVIVEKDKETTGKVEIDKSRMGLIRGLNPDFKFEVKELYIAIRTGGAFSERALNLSGKFEWILCKDVDGQICLVPLEKGKEEKR